MKYRLLKLLRPDVAWHRRRFFSTAAVRDNPIPTKKTRTQIPKSLRKAMVHDYVTKYRAINEGKFPGVENTRNQVGGCYYTIRAILQELKYDFKDKDSVVQPAGQRNDTSAIKETVDTVLTIAEAEDSGDLFENGVLNEQVLVEKPSPDMTVMESATEDFNLYEKSELPFQRPGLSSKVCVEINKPSGKSPEFTMVPGPLNMKQQDDGSMLPAAEITNEAYQISKCTEIPRCQVITDRATVTDNVKVSAEIGSTNQGGVETGHSQTKLHVSSMVKSNSIPKEVSVNDTIVSEFDQTSTLGVDTMESIRVGDNLNLLEKSSTVEVIKASEMEKSQSCANSSLPSDIGGGDDTWFGGDKSVSPTTSITNGGYSRGTDTKETQEKEIEETLWGNLKSMANRFINIWR
ncbi:uncharacterized protein LOC141600340 [Silene latifolia]|uniref:uncharacterized protein LOC141600340 n=1 Tax=Silene latifolia TaxID=37657 RepID=UPI003D785674